MERFRERVDDQPMIRLEHKSTTIVKYIKDPSATGRHVMSPTSFSPSRSAVKSRSGRSGTAAASGSARTQAIQALRALLMQSDEELKNQCAGLGPLKLCRKPARPHPGAPVDSDRASRLDPRSLAPRWLGLEAEITELTDAFDRGSGGYIDRRVSAAARGIGRELVRTGLP